LPHCVVALRGNHESEFATMAYGFHSELVAKYGSAAKGLYSRVLKVRAGGWLGSSRAG
jgi:hypothetical protein